MQGGMEAIYDDISQPIGMMRFAPLKPARGSMFGAARRAAHGPEQEAVVRGGRPVRKVGPSGVTLVREKCSLLFRLFPFWC